MSEKLASVFVNLLDRFIVYIPQLLVGLVLLICGWVFAWLFKRFVVRMAIILKLDSLLVRSRWKAAFQKADVRYGFYSFLGNIGSFIVFLIFLDFALITWDLTMLSNILGSVISFFPRFVTAAATFGLGWIFARWAAHALQRTLIADNLPHASGIAHYARIMLLVLAAAISLVELNIARQVVLIGFAVTYITLGTIAIVMSVMVVKRILNSQRHPEEKKGDQT